jgi:F-type H+-transporting ATPase subunit epsilon
MPVIAGRAEINGIRPGRNRRFLQKPVASVTAFDYKPRMNTMQMTLVTPEATFFTGEASMVEAPGTLGDFGALPGHMPFISTLKPGVVRIHSENDRILRIFVSGGIAEVRHADCTILAERVVDLATLTRADAESRMAKARTAMDNAVDEDGSLAAAREMEIAEAIVAALS